MERQLQRPEAQTAQTPDLQSQSSGFESRTGYPVQMARYGNDQVMQMIQVGDMPYLQIYGLDVGTWQAYEDRLAMMFFDSEVLEVITLLKTEKASPTSTEALRRARVRLQALGGQEIDLKEAKPELGMDEFAELYSAMGVFEEEGRLPDVSRFAKLQSTFSKMDDGSRAEFRRSHPNRYRVFHAFVFLPDRFQSFEYIIPEVKNANLGLNPAVRAELKRRLDAMDGPTLFRLNQLLTGQSMIEDFQSAIFYADTNAGERIRNLKTVIKLKFYEFAGADSGKIQKQLGFAGKLYQDHGIALQVVGYEKLTPETTKKLLGNLDGKFVTVKSGDSKAKERERITTAEIVKALPGGAGVIPCYWFGNFQTDHGGFWANFFGGDVLAYAQNSSTVFLGTNTVQESTFAHELGHVMGGKKYGEHVDDAKNLMHKDAARDDFRLSDLQIVAFKGSVFASLL